MIESSCNKHRIWCNAEPALNKQKPRTQNFIGENNQDFAQIIQQHCRKNPEVTGFQQDPANIDVLLQPLCGCLAAICPGIEMPFELLSAGSIMNTLAHALFLIAGFVALALSGQFLVNRFAKIEVLERHHSAGEAMMGVVGTLFSVLLGFMVASAMDKYHEAQMHSEQEASTLATVFRISRGLSDQDRPRMLDLCRQYLNEVIDVEWPQMERREQVNKSWDCYQKLWDATVSVVPENDRQSNLQQGLIATMQNLGEHRRARVLLSRSELPASLWVIVILGAAITIALSYVFASQHKSVQGFLIALVATALALNVWLLAAYSHPFSGELALRPSMFLLVKESLSDKEDASDQPAQYVHDKESTQK